jgi:hypothetical protein
MGGGQDQPVAGKQGGGLVGGEGQLGGADLGELADNPPQDAISTFFRFFSFQSK